MFLINSLKILFKEYFYKYLKIYTLYKIHTPTLSLSLSDLIKSLVTNTHN